MRTCSLIWITLLVCLGFPTNSVFAQAPQLEVFSSLRLNQIQVIGTHNSYHIQPHPSIMQLITQVSPQQAKSIAYSHRPLAEQFSELGIRQIELDVYADPEGGHYAKPMGCDMVTQANLPPVPDPDPNGELQNPGLKILHAPDVDFATTVRTFESALQQIKTWSSANPNHLPILILVEAKQDRVVPLFPKPKPFDKAAFDAVDAEIRSVFAQEQILTPDNIRGNAETLREVIISKGWPRLDDVRGKVLFALDNGGQLRDDYLAGHPALKGRVLFADVPVDHPAAAFVKLNDPVSEFKRIQKLVRQGFLVRTRADADTRQARDGDTTRRDKALASGAQFVSTDYPEPNREWSPYCVRLPDSAVARPNPVNSDTPDE